MNLSKAYQQVLLTKDCKQLVTVCEHKKNCLQTVDYSAVRPFIKIEYGNVDKISSTHVL